MQGSENARKPAEGTTLRVPDGNILLSVLGVAAADWRYLNDAIPAECDNRSHENPKPDNPYPSEHTGDS
jgi:hypothetical protein